MPFIKDSDYENIAVALQRAAEGVVDEEKFTTDDVQTVLDAEADITEAITGGEDEDSAKEGFENAIVDLFNNESNNLEAVYATEIAAPMADIFFGELKAAKI